MNVVDDHTHDAIDINIDEIEDEIDVEKIVRE
jgi:hypothetical protein